MNKMVLHPTTWVNLKNIMLSERDQMQKTTYCMVLLIKNSRNGKIIVTETDYFLPEVRDGVRVGLDCKQMWNNFLEHCSYFMGFWGGSVVMNLSANAEVTGLICGLGRSPREENDNPLQYSCLGNSMTEDPSGLQSRGFQRVRHGWMTQQQKTVDILHLNMIEFTWWHTITDTLHTVH